PLLERVPAVTTTLPLVTPFGAVAVMLVSDPAVTVAIWPLNLTVPVVEVKFFPAMVTGAPGSPLAGVGDAIIGATVNATPLLVNNPLVSTSTFRVVAPRGTQAWMLESDQVLIPAVVPLNVTLPEIP